MRQSFPVLRRAAMVVIAVMSVLAAAFLVWSLATPERLGGVPNAYLMGMLALLVLPAAALGAWELDRRASLRRADDSGQREDDAVHVHEPARERERQERHRRRVRHAADERVGR